MLISPKLLAKVRRLVGTYEALIFRSWGEIPVEAQETCEHFRTVPPSGWTPIEKGFVWGEPWGNAWFRGTAVVPDAEAGVPVYIRAHTDGVETLLWVDGRPRGLFAHATEAAARGGHHTLLLDANPQPGRGYEISLESYAGHPVCGTQPFDDWEKQVDYPSRFRRIFRGVELLARRDDVKDFVFDLRALVQLAEALPDDSFRRAKIQNGLEAIFRLVYQHPGDRDETAWRPPLGEARSIMVALLAVPNAPSAPRAGLIGHSHMDTAWTWPISETIRKCARTYSNVLSLMEQYPEYLFAQSSPYHAEMMRLHYPEIFAGMQRRIAEGRWEPLGGMWIECDCNLTSGESMIRQFLRGIAYTREHFGYRPDTFWLPDTFGYSAALPQILRGCGLRYFLTTKLTWNDTNTFPYDTFRWRGLDGSDVLVHFNDIHCWPDPATLVAKIHGGGPGDFRKTANYVQHKEVNDRRLISYGFGDGGGGPQYEMIEMARRCRDTEGCPKAEHVTVSRFMQELEETSRKIPVHDGELYFEGHRGTLTQIHRIKRGNRRAELALREAEFLAVARRKEAPELAALWDLLLVNQFHDILPGTSIPQVHDRAIGELEEVVEGAISLGRRLIGAPGADRVTLWNSLSWPRKGPLRVRGLSPGTAPAGPGIVAQIVRDLDDVEEAVVSGVEVPPLGSVSVAVVSPAGGPSPFRYRGEVLETPFFTARFDAQGYLDSLFDKAAGRELRGSGLPLNAFLAGEDVPESWDNWDIDEDQKLKMALQTRLVRREVVADGPLEFRLRSEYRIDQRSRLRQDMIFRADTPQIDFDTEVEWDSPHTLLKAAFPLNLRAGSARHEIQFGHAVRPTVRNTSHERAMFEVCQHKWTAVSETRYGVALLNDGKYGLSTEGAELHLTLMKGGCHPDPRGDKGRHRFRYALLPHRGAFSAEAVIRPAYEFNVPLSSGNAPAAPSLFLLDLPHVVVEAVKPAADGRGHIVRFYEAEGCAGRGTLEFPARPARVLATNLLEEDLEEIPFANDLVPLAFRPFEIKTIRVIAASSPP
ncbi:alpha-mannosidase [Verrucomicrobium sp. GAS474]|uniref:alpha-mannosidase n=1 Tax=Verrucomicrobium sp. GAS474 TaxID=1882831 RepID=UPI0008799D75|nr:glycoside hydrolase family 38 C-terminal domain-containing protein [Verrucomicrobium sp. GAS474]SDT89189.1 alpha-mannosidase [Verrucomicrobium sp. GAS474]